MTRIESLAINTIRMLSADAVQAARSGHPGMPMGAAPMAYVLWTRFLRHNPKNPRWPNRDRFFLSAGHGSMLQYSLLHLTGYDLSLDEIRNFRQWGSRTPGHPEYGLTPGVEVTTGPLGQGMANGVGMAIAQAHLAARFNRPGFPLFDHWIYGVISDGDLMEGISQEAISLAGHLGLGRIVYLYDDNRVSIEGDTDITFSEDRLARFVGAGWHAQAVADGNDLDAVEAAIRAAREETARPSVVAVRTRIGEGSPGKAGTARAHGEPLGEAELALTKRNLDWPAEPAFHVPAEVRDHFRGALEAGPVLERNWETLRTAYADAHPEAAAELRDRLAGNLPEGWGEALPEFPADPKGLPTRVASGRALNALAGPLAGLMGGSADLGPSNKTLIDDSPDFQAASPDGRNLRFGVREHGMAAMLNGMALYGGMIPYGGTFLIFSEYMRPAIRMAALMGLHVIYVFTHDSIGLGEDGPTHQPVEQLAVLRATPGLTVIRPGDANEAAAAWEAAVRHDGGPVALALTRQDVPTLDRSELAPADGLRGGAYVLWETAGRPLEVLLIGTGSELAVALDVGKNLADEGIGVRVVSMPSWELFDRRPEAEREAVLPRDVPLRIVVEAGCDQGWHRYIGRDGVVFGVNRFGASAPWPTLFEKFGLTPETITSRAKALYNAKKWY
jgi:transketolase